MSTKRHSFFRTKDEDTNYWLTEEELPDKDLHIIIRTCHTPSRDYSGEEVNSDFVLLEAEILLTTLDTNIFVNGIFERYHYGNVMTVDDGHEYWEKKGRLIGKNSSISRLVISFKREEEGIIRDDCLLCVKQLYKGITTSSSVEKIEMNTAVDFLTDGNNSLPSLNLCGDGVFSKLRSLDLRFDRQMNDGHQHRAVVNHLKDISLDYFQMNGRSFKLAFVVDMPSANMPDFFMTHQFRFKNFLSALRNVKEMNLCCDYGFTAYNHLSEFLQQPAIKLESLWIPSRRRLFDMRECQSMFEDGLKHNNTVRILGMYNADIHHDFIHDSVIKMLCDVSSIPSICHSNHTLEKIYSKGEGSLWSARDRDQRKYVKRKELVKDLLRINSDVNKNTAMRIKIIRYFLCGDFDVSYFRGVPSTIFPRLMSSMNDEESQINAIYKFVRNIPNIRQFR